MKSLKKILLLLSMLTILLASSISTVFAADLNSTEFSSGFNLSSGESKAATFFIRNNDTAEHRYALIADGSANSYELYFSSGGVSIKSVTVPAGTNVQFDLNINLKGNALVNEDKLIVKAVREDGKESIISLAIQINKDYALSIKSMLDKIDVLNGKSAEVTFLVMNNGSKDLNSVKIEPELPYKWIASQGFDAVIDLKPGETGTLKMTVEVPSSQAAGNFTAKFTAVSDKTKSDQLSVPITVKTGSNIAYWMIGVVVLIAGVTLVQFKKHGRR